MILVGKADEGELLNLAGERKGSVVCYFGYVREFANGKKVSGMQCKESETTRKVMEEIEREITSKYPVEQVILYHTLGNVAVGKLLAAVVVSTVHREEGFNACRMGIELIKEREPVLREEY